MPSSLWQYLLLPHLPTQRRRIKRDSGHSLSHQGLNIWMVIFISCQTSNLNLNLSSVSPIYQEEKKEKTKWNKHVLTFLLLSGSQIHQV
jgi:hypothetical protein